MLARLTGFALLSCFLWVSWHSAIAARADLAYRENTLPSLNRAVTLSADNAVFSALYAEQLERAGHDARPQLTKTTRLSPLESQYWVRLAFQEEIEGNYRQAEIHLLHAAEVDHKADPRWALMNFYFRRNNEAAFWSWVTRALQMSQGDVTSIFRLAWARSLDENYILSRIPNRPDLMAHYLEFLKDTDRLDSAAEVALRVARASPRGYLALLLDYCNRYSTIDSPRALPVWNALCDRKLIPYPPLDPGRGAIVTNPALASDPLQRGFDWKIKSVDGVSASASGDGGIRVELAGHQPEECTILEQPIPLQTGRTYVISWESGSSPGEHIPGLIWNLVQSAPTPQNVPAAISGESGANKGVLAFKAAGNSGSLRLGYKRPLGSVRAKGVVTIRNLEAAVQP